MKTDRWNGTQVEDWTPYLMKRCLVVEDSYISIGIEVMILEVSPSKKFVKFKFPSGTESWENARTWLLIECLGDEKLPQPILGYTPGFTIPGISPFGTLVKDWTP